MIIQCRNFDTIIEILRISCRIYDNTSPSQPDAQGKEFFNSIDTLRTFLDTLGLYYNEELLFRGDFWGTNTQYLLSYLAIGQS